MTDPLRQFSKFTPAFLDAQTLSDAIVDQIHSTEGGVVNCPKTVGNAASKLRAMPYWLSYRVRSNVNRVWSEGTN